jgi:antitoxin ParD1/3/4
MNVSLTPDLEQLVHDRLQSGQYASSSEVIREALCLLKERDEERRLRLEQLRTDIQAGIAAADRGDLVDGERFFHELRRELELRVGAEGPK